jgi:hypothetical protein
MENIYEGDYRSIIIQENTINNYFKHLPKFISSIFLQDLAFKNIVNIFKANISII